MHERCPAIGVVGLGRLGSAIVERCASHGLPLVVRASGSTGWQVDAVPDVLIDASAPRAHEQVWKYCDENGVALIECVSNLSPSQWSRLDELASRVPVLRATNLTVGHYLQDQLIRYVASTPLAVQASASVSERHPASKAHRPSATAVELAHTWTRHAGQEPTEISARRCGLPVSEHEFVWTWAAETLVVRHSVGSLDAAADGALVAAAWLHGRPPGTATMRDVYDHLASRDPGVMT